MTEGGKTVYTKYYLGGNYEAHCDGSGTEERLYVGGDCYEAPALLVRKEGKTEIRFLHRDYLGSILQVADNKGNIIEEVTAIAKGQNFWHGNAIAQGRGMFSWKNTPVGETGASNSVQEVMPDAMPKTAKISEPTSAARQAQRLTPYQKGQEGVNRAITEFQDEGGIVHQTEVTIELNGVRNRFDFVGEKNGLLHLFEVKNGPTARMTPNQKINIPIMQKQTPPFVPVGNNAKNVPAFNNLVGGKYTGKYIVIYRHYF